jgi:hypothetical protein
MILSLLPLLIFQVTKVDKDYFYSGMQLEGSILKDPG